MPKTFQDCHRIEFRDTDAAGIMHFSAYFDYMEETEHNLLRSLGLSVIYSDAEGQISFPRVRATCDFRGPVTFDDLVDIEACVVRLGGKSVTYGFVFRHEGRLVAEGEVTAVCCRLNGGLPKSIPIPDELRSKLAEYLVEPQD